MISRGQTTTGTSGIRMQDRPEHDPDEMRAFLMIVRQALKMITAYIERRYSL
jgi:hypothetical protein